MRVGMIGLGNIGGHIANNLVADGHEVTVFDVDPARAAAIKGGETAASVAAVGKAAEITMLSLPSPAAVRQVADEWTTTAPAGSILVDLSTNSPGVVQELGTRLAASGHHPPVVADRSARYFGAAVGDGALLPGPEARIADVRLVDWAARQSGETAAA